MAVQIIKNMDYNTFGVRGVSLSYIIRDVENMTPEIGADASVT